MARTGRLDAHRCARLLMPWLVLGVLATVPSLLWLVRGSDLLTDDFGHVLAYREHGLWGGFLDRSFESTGRPLVGVHYLLTYGLIGDHRAAHAAFLVLLNAALVLTIWRVGRRLVDPRLAYGAALFMAVTPNRGSTRLWFATSNYVLAMTLVVLGFGLLAVHARPVAAAMTLLVATLLFEGTAGLLAALMVLWVWSGDRERLRTAVRVWVPSGVAAVAMVAMSPKDIAVERSGSSVSTFGHGLFGSGVWGDHPLALVGATALLGAMAVGMITSVGWLPSFRRDSEMLGAIRMGTLVTVCAAAPFVVGGSQFAVRGIFDRSNLVPDLGVGIVVAALFVSLHRLAPVLCISAVVVLVGCLTYLSARDVDDYRAAAAQGRTILARLEADVPAGSATVLVGPRPATTTGVEPYIYPTDLDEAVRLRTHLARRVLMPRTAGECRHAASEEEDVIGYDWRSRTVTSAGALCDGFNPH